MGGADVHGWDDATAVRDSLAVLQEGGVLAQLPAALARLRPTAEPRR